VAVEAFNRIIGRLIEAAEMATGKPPKRPWESSKGLNRQVGSTGKDD